MSLLPQLFIDSQVAPRLARAQLFVPHHKIRIADSPPRSNGLMHGSLPAKAHSRAQNSLPIIGKGRISLRVKGHMIGSHHHVKAIQHVPLETHQSLRVLHHVVSIQPHEKITGCMRKRFVTCGGKVILPEKVVHMRRIAPGNLPRLIL